MIISYMQNFIFKKAYFWLKKSTFQRFQRLSLHPNHHAIKYYLLVVVVVYVYVVVVVVVPGDSALSSDAF